MENTQKTPTVNPPQDKTTNPTSLPSTPIGKNAQPSPFSFLFLSSDKKPSNVEEFKIEESMESEKEERSEK